MQIVGPKHTMSKFDEATFRWASTLFFGLILTPMNMFGVWVARRNAFGINSIELTPWWYLFALIGPLLSVVITILVPRSNWIWKGPLLCNVLIVLMLVSFAHIPAMYIAGGFR